MFLSLLVLRTRVVDRAKSGISHGGSMSVKVGAKLRETDDDSEEVLVPFVMEAEYGAGYAGREVLALSVMEAGRSWIQ